jgi:predicted NBD/HSP70 family sugar kinase
MSRAPYQFSCCIERCQDCKEVQAFLPTTHLNINLSIGGTKILTAIVDPKGKIIWESGVFKWRHDLDKLHGMSSLEKRNWFISHMIQEVLKAEDYGRKNIENCVFECVGISWPGPILRNGALLAPNIDGFKYNHLSQEEVALGGISLQALLMNKFSEMGKNWNVCILNDSDAEGSVTFAHDEVDHGMLVILGTGIGAGIILNKKWHFGPPDFISRMGEIGQHLIYDNSKGLYSYYGVRTKGIVLSEIETPTMQDRLAGPAVAKRFLDQLQKDFNNDITVTESYLNTGVEENLIEEHEIANYYNKLYINLKTEEKILKLITAKALQGDERAIQFIGDIGYEIGSALGVFIFLFKDKPYVKHIKLAGSLGQHFGLKVRDLEGDDLFISQIKKGIHASLRLCK